MEANEDVGLVELTPTSIRENEKSWADVIFLLLLIIGGFGAALLFIDTINSTDIPMPCSEHEVYVWERGQYPYEAQCVEATDHGAHNAG